MKSLKMSAVSIAAVLALSCPALGAQIVIGPVLEDPSTNTMTLMWETDIPADCAVIIADPSGRETRLPCPQKGVRHLVTVSDLNPNTTYRYRVMEGSASLHAASFTTLGTDDLYTVAFIGDTRNNPTVFGKLLGLIEKAHPSFIVNLGDMVSNGDDTAQWKRFFFDVGRTTFDHVPLVAVLGNHDLDDFERADFFRRYFPPPKTTPDGRLYYSFRVGADLFVVLDIYTDRLFFPFSEGMWLWDTLKSASRDPKTRHVFVLSHEGISSYKGRRTGFFGLRLFCGVMGRNGVTALIASHDHYYVRGETYSGFPFFATGGGGAPLYDVNRRNILAALAGRLIFGKKTYNVLFMDVRGDVVTFRAVDENGRLIDETRIDNGKK
jgi:hypothetical protein